MKKLSADSFPDLATGNESAGSFFASLFSVFLKDSKLLKLKITNLHYIFGVSNDKIEKLRGKAEWKKFE